MIPQLLLRISKNLIDGFKANVLLKGSGKVVIKIGILDEGYLDKLTYKKIVLDCWDIVRLFF